MTTSPGNLERILRWLVIERGTAEISDLSINTEVAPEPPVLRLPDAAAVAGPVVLLERRLAEPGVEQRSSFAVMTDTIVAGDVVLVGCDPDLGAAFGSNIALHAAACRAQALMTDGAWRDQRLLRGLGMVMAAGSATPKKAAGRRYVQLQRQTMFGLEWSTGDWLFADTDGVLRLRADAASSLAGTVESDAGGELSKLLHKT